MGYGGWHARDTNVVLRLLPHVGLRLLRLVLLLHWVLRRVRLLLLRIVLLLLLRGVCEGGVCGACAEHQHRVRLPSRRV
jgi:hypothetical protein